MGSFAGVFSDNTRVFEQGKYLCRGRGWIDLSDALEKCQTEAQLHGPDELEGFLHREPVRLDRVPVVVEVIEGKTGDVARELAGRANGKVGLLNFASATNAGGGYKRGAMAQEEDLCRCSALYPCLLTQPDYYRANRSANSRLYTDHIIFVPDVPFFRDDCYEYLEEPVLLSVVTAPAPNAGAFLGDGGTQGDLEVVLHRRAGMVLAVAEEHGVRNLVLGAWGCGVFRNDPEVVADAFGSWIESPRFRGSFDRIVFGIYAGGVPGKVNLEVFQQRFEGRSRQ